MEFEPIFKTTNEINYVAESFLASYHPDMSIPVPIEKIIDNSLKIDIIPFPDLIKDALIERILPDKFQVSSTVIRIRLERDRLI